ncbi:hypothetical protein JAGODDHD_04139 [Sphingomonas paucimobilis]|nr:hypothetical protein [Sphingomonas paucimobilis]
MAESVSRKSGCLRAHAATCSARFFVGRHHISAHGIAKPLVECERPVVANSNVEDQERYPAATYPFLGGFHQTCSEPTSLPPCPDSQIKRGKFGSAFDAHAPHIYVADEVAYALQDEDASFAGYGGAQLHSCAAQEFPSISDIEDHMFRFASEGDLQAYQSFSVGKVRRAWLAPTPLSAYLSYRTRRREWGRVYRLCHVKTWAPCNARALFGIASLPRDR